MRAIERGSLTDARVAATKALVEDLVGRVVTEVTIAPIGVIIHFGSKNGDNGVAYWASGRPRP